jgi:L-lysine exporter family protein LysE/ArgO
MTRAFLHGLLLAFGLILPLGAQNVFVFNQGVNNRKWASALPVVVMAGLCDTFLILLAVLGVSLLVLTIAWFKILLTVVGVGFLLYMAITTWRNPVGKVNNQEGNEWSLRMQLIFAASVSLLNPHAILDTIGVIGTSSLTYTVTGERLAFTIATIMVSWVWFVGLMTTGHVIGKLPNSSGWQKIINRLSAIIMALSAVVLIKTLFLVF